MDEIKQVPFGIKFISVTNYILAISLIIPTYLIFILSNGFFFAPSTPKEQASIIGIGLLFVAFIVALWLTGNNLKRANKKSKTIQIILNTLVVLGFGSLIIIITILSIQFMNGPHLKADDIKEALTVNLIIIIGLLFFVICSLYSIAYLLFSKSAKEFFNNSTSK